MPVATITSQLLKTSLKYTNLVQNRFLSCAEIIQRRSDLFSLEKKRQSQNVGRIEKIEVRFLGVPNDTTLVMNKGLSTPYNCAQHLGEMHCQTSTLALTDGKIPWDMHRPLQESCTLQLLNFTIADPNLVNRAFWRTCSFMLGAVLQEVFKEEAGLYLHSFPSPNIKSGSFLHDIVIKPINWEPTKSELRAISAGMVKLASKSLPIERLEVNADLATEMFKDNPYKNEQLPSISNQNNGKIVVYRVGDHVDISRGPMVGSTNFLGKCTISAVHRVHLEGDKAFYRVQGVALPVGIKLNHVAFGIIEDRSKLLNAAKLPHESFEEGDEGKKTEVMA